MVSLALWALVVVLGLGTLAYRLSFIEAFASAEGVPPNVRAALRYVPPAVLAALVLPAFLLADGSLAVGPGNDRLLAGGVAAVVAWRTGSVLGTLVVGMVALYLLRSGLPV
ncbi:MAG: AzlD domain-containing protein [Haloarculaceae archaeon]